MPRQVRSSGCLILAPIAGEQPFEVEASNLPGKTAIGRVTVGHLGMNSADQVLVRNALLKEAEPVRTRRSRELGKLRIGTHAHSGFAAPCADGPAMRAKKNQRNVPLG
jgi:hypothetical protein